MSSPTPIVVRLQTPVPVTVRGTVPVVAHTAIPVSAHSPLPVDVIHSAPSDSWVAYLTLGIAFVTFLAVLYQIYLARVELKILARSPVLVLMAREAGDAVRASFVWQQFQDSQTGQTVARCLITLPLSIVNIGSRGVEEALLYLWYPPNVSPLTNYDPAGPWRKESFGRKFRGVQYEVSSYRVERQLYPKPFRTDETIYFVFDDRRPVPANWPPAAKPPQHSIYWQVVCEDGTYPSPDFYSELRITFP